MNYKKVEVHLTNLAEQEVDNYINDGSEQILISTNELEKGIYVISISTVDGKQQTKKIVRQ